MSVGFRRKSRAVFFKDASQPKITGNEDVIIFRFYT